MSFADGTLPRGSQFLGACIVSGETVLHAIGISFDLGINPGGEVKAIEVVPSVLRFVDDKWRNRLLNREECRLFDEEVGARQEAANCPPPDDIETVTIRRLSTRHD